MRCCHLWLSAAALLAAWLLAAPAHAGPEDGAPNELIAIVGATVHTGTGAPRDDVNVTVEGGVITGIGTDAPPAHARVINGKGRQLTAGLTVWSAIGLLEIMGVEETVDANADGDPVRSGLRAADAFNRHSTLLAIARSGGITTTVSFPYGGFIAGQALAADLLGPYDGREPIFGDSVAMLGYLGSRGGSSVRGNRALALLRMRELFDDAKTLASKRRDFEARRLRTLSASHLDLAALSPVVNGKQPLVVEVHRASDIRAALQLQKDYGLKLAILGGSEAWMVAKELAAAKVPVALDPFANLPDGFDGIGTREDNAALLERAGVEVVLLSGSWPHNERILRQAAGNAVRAGMSHSAALRAITLAPLKALGLATDRGTIEKGKVANLVLWSGDPFELSSEPVLVLVRGDSPPPVSRQTKLFERYCGPFCSGGQGRSYGGDDPEKQRREHLERKSRPRQQ